MPRLNLSITKKADERLETLLQNEQLDFTSKAEIVRMSLSLLDFFIKEEEQGNSVSISKNGEVLRDVILHV